MPERWTLYSGLQYRYDPGVSLVGVGAFVLLAGLIISFYFVPGAGSTCASIRRRRPAARPLPDAGTSASRRRPVKGYDIFEEQFGALVEAMRKIDRTAAATG